MFSAVTGTEGLGLIKQETPDIILLDVSMPEMDGFEVLKRIRDFSDLPVIMLTVADREADIVKGLQQGAADYIVKPFRPMELLARTRAVLRRVQMWPLGTANRPLVSERLSVDFDSHEVRVHGTLVGLTPTEYKLLSYMVGNPGQLLTHRLLLERVWGEGYGNSPGLLKIQIQHLRKKLQDDPRSPRLILTERGRGYIFRTPA